MLYKSLLTKITKNYGTIHLESEEVFLVGIQKNNVEDIDSLTAGFVVIGKANNGWVEWKDANGNKIDIYRKK